MSHSSRLETMPLSWPLPCLYPDVLSHPSSWLARGRHDGRRMGSQRRRYGGDGFSSFSELWAAFFIFGWIFCMFTHHQQIRPPECSSECGFLVVWDMVLYNKKYIFGLQPVLFSGTELLKPLEFPVMRAECISYCVYKVTFGSIWGWGWLPEERVKWLEGDLWGRK